MAGRQADSFMTSPLMTDTHHSCHVHLFLSHTGGKTAPETLQMQMNYLNRAMLYIPTPHDAERPKQYFPRNPYPVNAAFPSTPAPIFETPAIFEKLGPDTLFFIFYYQQGTYQQVCMYVCRYVLLYALR